MFKTYITYKKSTILQPSSDSINTLLYIMFISIFLHLYTYKIYMYIKIMGNVIIYLEYLYTIIYSSTT